LLLLILGSWSGSARLHASSAMSTARSVGRTASSVGMMEGAFFVSRTELLQWVNGLLQINITKVEQCASGAVYCQIVDSCFPGSVKMSKVNWIAKADHEFIPNFKILQAACDKNKIEKHIPVDMLIRAKYQDNLEFLQWMKAFWDREGSGRRDYDAVKAREGRPLPPWAKPLGVPTAPIRSVPAEKENQSMNREAGTPPGQKFHPSTRQPAHTDKAPAVNARPGSSPTAASPASEKLKVTIAEQEQEIAELGSTLQGLEQERDYYFGKLRKVEILCTTLQAKMDDTVDAARIIQDIQGILYAEEDDEPDKSLKAAEDSGPAAGLPLEAEGLPIEA